MTLPTFSAPGGSDLQQDTALALYLLHYLEHRRDSHERIWTGEGGLRTVQAACAVVEALHELNLKGLTHHLSEPAANWLAALPLDLPADSLRRYRLFPGRPKVLIQIGKLDAPRLADDLEALSQFFDPASGGLRDAPVDLSPALATLVWLDALSLFDAHNQLAPSQRQRLEAALPTVAAALDAFAQSSAQPLSSEPASQPASGLTAAEASYALDLLVRLGTVPVESDRAIAARCALLVSLSARGPGDLRRADHLSSAINLVRRFGQHTETTLAAHELLAAVRQRYADDACQREPIAYHAQVLRLIVALHGETLRTALLERLWQDSRDHAGAQQREEQAQLEAEFVALIRQTIRVHLTPPQRLTGTTTRGEVYRVRFGLTTASTDEHGAPLSTPRDTLRLIVKKGPPDVLARAIRRFRDMPEPLQRLFARHASVVDEPVSPGQWSAPGYLIMQDLADMLPLSEVLGQLDRPVILPAERERAATEAAAAVSAVLRGLHGHARQPSVLGHHLEVSYLAPLTQALERVAQPHAFPELHHWLGSPLTANRRRYRPPAWYLQQLRRHADRLNPPSLGYVHGDCHSRNLMLSHDSTAAKLVDIETLSNAEDYVVDYGLLLEDVAVYQSLPYGSERGRLEWDDIRTTRPGRPASAPDTYITYPAFPRSEAVIAFQTELLAGLRGFAESLGDEGWQRRLWLATARGLLLLASRQLTSDAIEPHRRSRGPRFVNDGKLAQVAYAEALRLLRELCDHLNSRPAAPLPALPFPGEHKPAHSTAAPANP